MTARIYLAGSSRELVRVRKWASAIEAAGGELASRWFDTAEQWSGRDYMHDDQEQRKRSAANLTDLRRAAIVWVLWPEALVSEGVPAELGYALAHRWHVGPRRMRIVLSGERARASINTAGADFRVARDELGLSHVLSLVRGDRGNVRRLARAASSEAPLRGARG